MIKKFRIYIKIVGIFTVFILFSACQKKEIKNVSFSADIQPILDEYCIRCHNSESNMGKLNFENYDKLMASRYFNRKEPVAIGGDVESSRLYWVVKTNNPAVKMPPGYSGLGSLSGTEKELIKVWINEGAKNN